jgi:hypothetical protein
VIQGCTSHRLNADILNVGVVLWLKMLTRFLSRMSVYFLIFRSLYWRMLG